jgi:hypothetical protein
MSGCYVLPLAFSGKNNAGGAERNRRARDICCCSELSPYARLPQRCYGLKMPANPRFMANLSSSPGATWWSPITETSQGCIAVEIVYTLRCPVRLYLIQKIFWGSCDCPTSEKL